MIRCMGCMEEIPEGEGICRHCGYQQGTDVKEAYYLLPGKVVGGKYMIGKVLGYGGFGVTYIGWDNTLRRKVAVCVHMELITRSRRGSPSIYQAQYRWSLPKNNQL